MKNNANLEGLGITLDLPAISNAPEISATALATLPEQLQSEVRCYLAMKPYLAHCIAMNHDLNNPLAGIIGYSELMIDDTETPEVIREQLRQILTCAMRIHFFVDQLSQEKIELYEKIDLNALEQLYRPLARQLEEPLDRRNA